ncbi:MAG TPA: VOC family protein [Phenylobacterium sp.]|nr:VOC family protein [Phenylobacterium sp.]
MPTLGRLIDHIHLRARDLAATQRFYAAILEVLAIPYVSDDHHLQADELWIDAGEAPSRVHLAFQAKDRATVDRAYAAGLAAGGRDNGPPGERHYHPGYYAAFLWDPDGNNIEAVHHGPATRSAASIEVKAA